ncbi:MAG TPA: response regulator transcription factor [Pyrinomonadaceae bacterium]|jgi:DNA-binding NarL/FixJ family response regulator
MSKLRILLAEDHETVREGLRLIVNAQSDMEVVGEAGDGRSAVASAQELLPDIVVMDVSMPQLNGLKATEKLKQVCPQVKVLTLTRHTDYGYLQQLLRAGASGYVLKQSPPTELLHAIRAVAAGGKYLDPAVAGQVIGSYSERTAPLRVAAQGGRELSEREAEVLRLIAWGYSNKEIAARLDISVKTVEAHKANAMKRLNITSRIDIVRFALLQGWLQDT